MPYAELAARRPPPATPRTAPPPDVTFRRCPACAETFDLPFLVGVEFGVDLYGVCFLGLFTALDGVLTPDALRAALLRDDTFLDETLRDAAFVCCLAPLALVLRSCVRVLGLMGCLDSGFRRPAMSEPFPVFLPALPALPTLVRPALPVPAAFLPAPPPEPEPRTGSDLPERVRGLRP